MKTNLVIMAGGIGSRFWPMSTPDKPKQFIDITGCGRTMIQQTLDRFGSLVAPENVWVVTSQHYAEIVAEQLPLIPRNHILLEPCMRNTAPCLTYVTWRILKEDPQANIVVTPADHIVENVSEFQRIISKGLAFVSNGENILTLGMQPTRPETGYGYIQQTPACACGCDNGIYKVKAFKEKPDLDTAKEYLAQGGFFWNSGLFLWNVKTIEKALRAYASDITEIFDRLDPVLGTEAEQSHVNSLFPTCRAISIDYAVMENATNAYVLPADFGWSDLGTWGSLHTLVSSDDNRNSVVGNGARMVESSNCMVHLPDGKKALIQGLDGYIVAEHNGTLMICRLDDEQRIKEFSAMMK